MAPRKLTAPGRRGSRPATLRRAPNARRHRPAKTTRRRHPAGSFPPGTETRETYRTRTPFTSPYRLAGLSSTLAKAGFQSNSDRYIKVHRRAMPVKKYARHSNGLGSGWPAEGASRSRLAYRPVSPVDVTLGSSPASKHLRNDPEWAHQTSAHLLHVYHGANQLTEIIYHTFLRLFWRFL